jgi:hypothetical protein
MREWAQWDDERIKKYMLLYTIALVILSFIAIMRMS